MESEREREKGRMPGETKNTVKKDNQDRCKREGCGSKADAVDVADLHLGTPAGMEMVLPMTS